MAAPSNSSPSNKEIQESNEVAKEESIAETKESPAATPLSYEASESSDSFVAAKQLLAEGDFEQALSTIEQGIQVCKAQLISLGINSDLHECMAPFHYLYGTTLLYSVEESNDTQMTVPDGESGDNEEAREDMEIAWENLDTARNIVQGLLPGDSRQSKLELDLAQILLREGDLQRMNGRYTDAIQDYQACLDYRQTWLPPFDRKIADAFYNLGLSYLSHAMELQKEEQPDPTNVQLAREHSAKGTQLQVECAKTLCGQIAELCGANPDDILQTTGKTSALDASPTLQGWRQAVSSLTPTVAGDSTVDDLRQLLDEIQETIDEVDRSHQAVREANQLKLQAQKMADDGSTTQIGFGPPTLTEDSKPPAKPTEDSKPPAKPMMVKKKKKRDATETDSDAKRAKLE